MYGTELIVMIIATLNLTLGTTGQSIGVIGVTIFWRVILGIGIGGDYPNSSVLVSEFATLRWRGSMIAAVFAFQGLGAFSAALVSLLCTTGFKNSLDSMVCDKDCQLALDKSWRIIYGMGMLPAIIALYFRLTIPETIRYTLDVSHNESSAACDAVSFMDGERVDEATRLLGRALHLPGGFQAPPRASFRDFRRFFGLWKNAKILIGTAGSWFLLDIAFVSCLYVPNSDCTVRHRLEHFFNPWHYWIRPWQ
jgi:MFS transporter, PHS family, inorganic phosphate transporter